MLTIREEPIITAPSVEDFHAPENASSSLTRNARPFPSFSENGSHEAAHFSDQIDENGPSYAGEQQFSGLDQQLITRPSSSIHRFSDHEAARNRFLVSRIGLELGGRQFGLKFSGHEVARGSAEIPGHDFDDDVQQQAFELQLQQSHLQQPASEQGSHEAANVLDNAAQQQASELQPQPSHPRQFVSMTEQGSHEAANVLSTEAQQKMPGADQTEPYNSYQSASMSEQGSHEAANVLSTEAQQGMPEVEETTYVSSIIW